MKCFECFGTNDKNKNKKVLIKLQDLTSLSHKRSYNIISLEEIDFLNHCRLNRQFQIMQNFSRKEYLDYFILFAKHIVKQQAQQIDKFGKQIKDNILKPGQTIIKWMVKSQFIMKCLDYNKKTQIPQIIGHLTYINHELFHQIKQKYQQQHQQNFIYVLLQLCKQQIQFINQNLNSYLTFPTFIFGFTDRDKAIQNLKTNQNFYMFSIKICKGQKVLPNYDYGYSILQKSKESGENVLFNLQNFFQISSQIDHRQIILFYERLAYCQYKRKNDLERWNDGNPNRFNKFQRKLLIHNDHLQKQKKHISNETDLFQLMCRCKFQQRDINNCQQPSNYLQGQLNLNKLDFGDLYLKENNYQQAIQWYEKHKNRFEVLIKIGQINLKLNIDNQKIIQEIQPFVKCSQKIEKLEQIFYCRYLLLKILYLLNNQSKVEEVRELCEKCVKIARNMQQQQKRHSNPIFLAVKCIQLQRHYDNLSLDEQTGLQILYICIQQIIKRKNDQLQAQCEYLTTKKQINFTCDKLNVINARSLYY